MTLLSIFVIASFILIGIVVLSPLLSRIIKKSFFQMKLSETIYRFIFDSSPIGMGVVSLKGHWLQTNKALCHILGYSKKQLQSMNFQNTLHPDDPLENLKDMHQLKEGIKPFIQLEQRFITNDRTVTWILLTISLIRNNKGIPLYYIVQLQDINDKRKTENELSYKAYFDALTGLFNRNQLEHSLQSSISSALRHQKRFTIFYIDLDYFKKINDHLGHDTGDQLLKIVGERLKHNIRQTDIAARIGGDEFILVLNGVNSPETAAIFAEKIIDILIKPIKIKEHELLITASIGISFYPLDGADFNSLIKSADLALYKAKENGRNNYQFCTPEMNNEIKEKINFKHALETALENHEFHLVYLPKLDVKKNTITGFEALLRWKNQKYGDVSPNKIIPLADEMGIISKLSQWIIETALEKAKIWQQYGLSQPTKIAINISARHYMENQFVDNILQILNNTHLPPEYLQLEINENLIMRDPTYSLKVIQKLKNNGIQIIIDNFGTGYSSLNYLHQFSVDYIKIDRHFTQSIHLNDNQVLFLTALVDLAKNLNIKTLAEGVESNEQMELLARIGCDEIQGFYISQPILADDIPLFLENHAKVEHLPILKES
jgi:diguanylate cyclase (GGDEF)-like protein/PAS domain S-box-containing protein